MVPYIQDTTQSVTSLYLSTLLHGVQAMPYVRVIMSAMITVYYHFASLLIDFAIHISHLSSILSFF